MKKIFLLFCLVVGLGASDIRIAAGAGYKKMTLELLQNFKNQNKIEAIFGNMKQVTTQAKNQDITLIIGDKRYLDSSNLDKIGEQKIGNGKLVLIYPKNTEIKSINDLTNENIKKVALPDSKKAIYGIASSQALKSANLDIENKLLFVSTVPQSASYVLSGEVDAGFINLSEALSIKDKIGGMVKVDESLYEPIQIIALKLDSCSKFEVCGEFLEFLQTKKAKEIISKYGL
ncbi:ABC transporter, periplasmic substrate-binding protein [Campylobacter blaseri]|uniref:Molybdate ABC transporter substrate-binding protein n=1 Tax=Campylobacter blaseri TaxID=2042961 RepID=A0A2P8R1C7_9BACT|nr:molybdate ABC transporter substrate-binding protein [Campylobacter blaseri]PSM52299.1 molybdate ABC transporter substrate-binding protein [Campylobacter blaseri]PSM54065.1 molybdate ABC transporter substrate-binding protein [Campylobacter blaseri]QKF85506.1 ABC transporter, periplasmic substrate-binding protein [Campylobacter blaseri]